MAITKFWMVYGIGRGAPTYRHETKDSAVKEACRLSLANPGSEFVVLKAIKAFCADIPQIKEVEITDAPVERVSVMNRERPF